MPEWFLTNFVEFMISSDWYHMIPLINNISVWFVLNHEDPMVQSRGRGFESHREQKLIFFQFYCFSKIEIKILILNKIKMKLIKINNFDDINIV